MRKELDEELCRKYPKIFINRNKPMTETVMCWGFNCGDGWYNIIDSLCFSIQGYVDWKNERTMFPQVIALQVKQKFGRLMFYVDNADERINGMIEVAEALSILTCERCGSPGKLVNFGWLATLCDEHAGIDAEPKLIPKFIKISRGNNGAIK